MDAIYSDKAPAPIGPYSQAIRCDRLLFISGQINPVPGDFKAEAKGVLDNLKAICEAAEISLRDVAKVTVFLADMADWPLFNEVYATYFTEHKPARSAVAVAGLPKNARVEVEAICNLPHAGDFIFD